MIDPEKILVVTQCTPMEPWKSEVVRLFKSLNLCGGKLRLAKKVACFSEDVDSSFREELESIGVNIHTIEPLDERYPYANKIQMLRIEEDYDVMVALDTDVVVSGDFSDFISSDKISAKGVDTDPLGLKNWKKLFEFFNLTFPKERFQTSITNVKTIPWFNSGVLFVPKEFCSKLYDSWLKYNTKLLENYYSLPFLNEGSSDHDHKFAFTDQYALALAIHDLKLPYTRLPLEFNFPTHYLVHENFVPDKISPYIIHYHHKTALSGNILLTPYQKVNDKINSINYSLTGMEEVFLEKNPLYQKVSNEKLSYASLSNEEIVQDLYKKILLRPADEEGLKYYKTQLDDNTISVDAIESALLHSDERSILEKWTPRSISVYYSDVAPTFSKNVGALKNKVAILTIPKSGTYLISKILSLAGFTEVKINAQNHSLMDYRWTSMDDSSNQPYHIPLEISTQMILPSQLLPGHVEYNDYSKKHLQDFHKIFAYRNLRDDVVSLMRHAENWGNNTRDRELLQSIESKPEKMTKFFNTYKMKEFLQTLPNRLKWFYDSDAFKISFEEIIGDYGKEIQHKKLFQLFEFLDVKPSKNTDEILNLALNSKTLTWSGKRSDYSEYWNSEVESKFCELRLDSINSILGFE